VVWKEIVKNVLPWWERKDNDSKIVEFFYRMGNIVYVIRGDYCNPFS